MKDKIAAKLIQAEKSLELKLPEDIFNFLTSLNESEVEFGNETWIFPVIKDSRRDPEENYIIQASRDFKAEWGSDGMILANNGIGDYLVLLPEKSTRQLSNVIYVILHEIAEIKIFASDITTALEQGPSNYFGRNSYHLKLDKGILVEGNDSTTPEPIDEETVRFLEDMDKKNLLDDWIDEEQTGKTSEILNGLEDLAQSNDNHYRIWALNKLSDLYLKGFGPLPKNLVIALDYNQQAMDLGSHKAFSNRAACYFAGIGVEKDLKKALELAHKANELSKQNMFADVFASREGGGLYDNLIDFIEKEIAKQKK